jgi:uncharacterized protein YndB with AHSA1/START domain
MSGRPRRRAREYGSVEIDREHASLVFRRRLQHPPEAVWRAITEPKELRRWFMTKATIDARAGGSVDGVSGPAQFHWTGRILTWNPPRIFEYEWNVAPRTELPHGEQSVVRWELTPTDDDGTLLVLTHRRLTKPTALGFAPGTHAFLDRLAAHLDQAPLPDWQQRFAEVRAGYPDWKPAADDKPQM